MTRPISPPTPPRRCEVRTMNRLCRRPHKARHRLKEYVMPSLLDRLMDSTMRCVKCNAPMGHCACWEKCSCGWSTERGQPCGNPATSRCSTKLKYGRPMKEWKYCKIISATKEAGPYASSAVTLVLVHACGFIERFVARSWCETKERPAPKRVKCYHA